METKIAFSAKLAFTLVSLVIIIWGLYVLQGILVPLTFSILFAILLLPLCRLLEHWRVPRVWAITLSVVVAIALLLSLIYLASAQIASLTDELPNLTSKVTRWTGKLQGFVSKNFHVSRAKQASEIQKYVTDALKNSASTVSNIFATTTNTLANLALIPIFVFFFLLYRDFFKRFFYQLFVGSPKEKLDGIFKRIYEVVQGYMLGLVLVIGIVGVLNTIGLLILGVDYAIFFGFFAAFLILIPYIGLLIGSVLPALLTLITHESPWHALGVLGIFGFVQVLEGNFITPNIVGSKISINPLAAMIVLILGGQLWGISGLILSLPLTAILKVIFDAIESLKPFGFLLGEAEPPHPPVVDIKQAVDDLAVEIKSN